MNPNQDRKLVYLGLSADFIHHGHINLISKASEYGNVMVGLLTDEAIQGHKTIPLLAFEERKQVILALKGVDFVVEQREWDYSTNLEKYKPNFFIHGDNWEGEQEILIRNNCIKVLDSYGGEFIEVPHTKGINSGSGEHAWRMLSIPEIRSQTLKRILEANRKNGKITRVIETHSAFSALIASSVSHINGNEKKIFDAFWSSSLTDSTLLGKPDTESVDLSTRLRNVEFIISSTSRPIIFDGDTGGRAEHLADNLKSVQKIGISAVVIEDKTGLKRNSLLGNEVIQNQLSIEEFSKKIEISNSAKLSPGFLVIARIESLVLEKGMEQAIERARKYVKAGADGIFISSKQKTPEEIFEFCKKFRNLDQETFLFVVPSTYSQVYESELHSNGVDVVIYANHLLRASFPAMKKVSLSILKNSRAAEAESEMLGINEILDLIPNTRN